MKFNPNMYKGVNKEGMKRQFERTQEKLLVLNSNHAYAGVIRRCDNVIHITVIHIIQDSTPRHLGGREDET